MTDANTLIKAKDISALKSLITQNAADTFNVVAVRQWFSELVGESLYDEKDQPRKGLIDDLAIDQKQEILNFIIEKLLPRQASFEDQISVAKEKIAAIEESKEDWIEAAKTLISIPLDSSYRSVSNISKSKIYLKIIRLLLEEEDSVQAEAYLHRCSAVLPQDEMLQLTFKVCQVRILDFKRKFIEAASRYYELSFLVKDLEEKNHCLSEAVKSAILAKAGSQRSRMLTTLFKDERVSSILSASIYKLLENVLMDRLLGLSEVQEFSKTLSPHQLASLGDGSTVLEMAVYEHNLLAVSKLYRSVSLGRLKELVGSEKVEKILANMINEGRLKAIIDQVNCMVLFKKGKGFYCLILDTLLEVRNEMIYKVCGRIDQVVDFIESK